jgi:hypothetical protein
MTTRQPSTANVVAYVFISFSNKKTNFTLMATFSRKYLCDCSCWLDTNVLLPLLGVIVTRNLLFFPEKKDLIFQR